MDQKNRTQIRMDALSPQNGSNLNNGTFITKREMEIIPRDVEDGQKKFDPFAERNINNPTTDFETLVHLLKAVFGTGILAMPFAFRQSGFLMGIIFSIFIGIISTHCGYILVKSAHILYYRTRKTVMTLPEVAEAALQTGPKLLRKYSSFSKYTVEAILFIAYFGTSSVMVVTATKNFLSVYNYYVYDLKVTDVIAVDYSGANVRLAIACLLIPFILMSWIPDLKYLAPFSVLANVFMVTSSFIIFYWIFGRWLEHGFPSEGFQWNLSSFQEFKEKFATFFSIVVFAFEAIGVIMPIENKMKNPQNFIGKCGVLNKGMTGIAIMYIAIGIIGFINDPKINEDMISLEMPAEEIKSQAVKIMVGLAVMSTGRLLFGVCLDIAEKWINLDSSKGFSIKFFIFRTFMMTLCVLLAVAVPMISPFMALIGATFFSIQGFLVPVILESITYWDIGFGFFKWRAIKNFIISIVAILAIYFGTIDAMDQINSTLKKMNGIN